MLARITTALGKLRNRINLAGRERKARVATGETYERTVTGLCDALAEVRDSAGRPAVIAVHD